MAPHRPSTERADVDGSGCLATPGLVNVHHHLYQWITRGYAQDGTLFEWLTTLYPVWRHLDADLEYHAARAALASLALSGCTTTTDHHYLFPRDGGDVFAAEVEAARQIGLRFHPMSGVDGPRAVAGRPAAGRRRRGSGRDPRRVRARGVDVPRSRARFDVAGRAGALLTVLGDR